MGGTPADPPSGNVMSALTACWNPPFQNSRCTTATLTEGKARPSDSLKIPLVNSLAIVTKGVSAIV